MSLLALSAHDSKLFKVAPKYLSLIIEVVTDTHIQPYTQNIKICETANACKTVGMQNIRILKAKFFYYAESTTVKVFCSNIPTRGPFYANELMCMDYIENVRRNLCKFHHSAEEMKCQLVQLYRANWANRTVLIGPIVPC